MYTGQQSRTRKANGHQSALYQAGYGGEERGTHELHLMRSRSFHVKATKRPSLTAPALVGGGALAWALLRAGNSPFASARERSAIPPTAELKP